MLWWVRDRWAGNYRVARDPATLYLREFSPKPGSNKPWKVCASWFLSLEGMHIQNMVCLKAFQVPLCLYEKAGHAGRWLVTAVPKFDSHWDSANAFVIFLGFFSQENRECRIEKLSPLSPVLQLVTLVHPLGAIAFIPATPNCIYWLFSFCLPDLIFFYFIAVSCCPSPPRSSPRVRISNQGRAQVPGVCCAGLLWQLANVWSVPSGTLSSMLF